MHILVVDDNEMNRLLATHVLRARGWEVSEASGGLEAMVRLENETFDGVLLDVGMPHLQGDQLCEWIRSEERMARMPVIAYTAHVLPDEVQRFRDRGFTDVLCKPVTAHQIHAAFDAHVGAD